MLTQTVESIEDTQEQDSEPDSEDLRDLQTRPNTEIRAYSSIQF